jgi:hypothetical protein
MTIRKSSQTERSGAGISAGRSAPSASAPSRSAVLAGTVFAAATLLPAGAASAASALRHRPHSPNLEAAEAVRVGLLIGVLIVAVLLFALAFGAKRRTLVIGADHRISTSKTIATVWTLVVATALFGIVYADLLNHPQALNALSRSATIGQYAVLFGGPLGAAILAKRSSPESARRAGAGRTIGTPSIKDLVSDENGNGDLGDLQYVLFNAVALLYVIGSLLHAPEQGLPHIPDVLLGLTGVSAAGCVGKKALPAQKLGATLDPATAEGPVGTPVTVLVDGVGPRTQRLSAWVRFGDRDLGQLAEAALVAHGRATLAVHSPALAGAPSSRTVSLVTEDGATLSAGAYTYT